MVMIGNVNMRIFFFSKNIRGFENPYFFRSESIHAANINNIIPLTGKQGLETKL